MKGLSRMRKKEKGREETRREREREEKKKKEERPCLWFVCVVLNFLRNWRK